MNCRESKHDSSYWNSSALGSVHLQFNADSFSFLESSDNPEEILSTGVSIRAEHSLKAG